MYETYTAHSTPVLTEMKEKHVCDCKNEENPCNLDQRVLVMPDLCGIIFINIYN